MLRAGELRGVAGAVDLKDRLECVRRRVLAQPLMGRLRQLLKTCSSLLDVGCGDDSPLQFLSFCGRMDGVDGFEPSIVKSRERGIHREYYQSDVLALGLQARSYDAVIALEVIEHLDKEDGKRFLASLEHIARRVVVISTPNGFVSQDDFGGNPFQRHRCGWSPSELEDLGYTVRGVTGWKSLRGPFAAITRKPYLFWAIVSLVSEPLLWNAPGLSFGLFCYKRVDTAGVEE